MKKINESELKDRVNRLKEYMAEMGRVAGTPVAPTAGVRAGRGGQGGPTAAQAATAGQAAKPSAPVAPKVAYEKDFPAATAMELQKKLNAAGEKLTVDGKMGPATRAAMARHPEITTDPNAPQNNPAPAAPTGDAAKNPVGTTNAATAIPTGGLENPANQAKPPAPTPAPATASTDPVAKAQKDLDDFKANPETAGDTAGLAQLQAALDKAKQSVAAPPGEASYTPPAAAPAPAPVKSGTGIPVTGGTPGDKDLYGSGAYAGESVKLDELQRLVSLVQYR